jgi:hypothetical protein
MVGILEHIRKLVGSGETAGVYDVDILTHINSTLFILNQLGVGPEEGFIADENSKWSDFLPAGYRLEMVKTYVYMKVKLMFDPPASSVAVKSMEEQVKEYESRLQIAADSELVQGGDPSV